MSVVTAFVVPFNKTEAPIILSFVDASRIIPLIRCACIEKKEMTKTNNRTSFLIISFYRIKIAKYKENVNNKKLSAYY